MCGIVGFIRGIKALSKVANDSGLRGFVEDAAIVGVLRGDDGTGGFSVDRQGYIEVAKMNVPGPEFARNAWAKTFFNAAGSRRGMILHHRNLTRGIASPENTHPFRHKVNGVNLVGCHNGVISNAPMKDDDIKFDVDSDWAMYQLAKNGNDAYKKMKGAFSFVYYREDTKKFYMSSNEERPLYFGFVKGEDLILLASELGMLRWLAGRRGFSFGWKENANKQQEEEVYRLTKGYVLEFPEDDLRNYSSTSIESYKESVYKSNSGFNNYGVYHGHRPFVPRNDEGKGKSSTSKVVTTKAANSTPLYTGPGGGVVQIPFRENLIRDKQDFDWGQFIPLHYDSDHRICAGTVVLVSEDPVTKKAKEEKYEGYIHGITRKQYRDMLGDILVGEQLWGALIGKRKNIVVRTDAEGGNIEKTMYYMDLPASTSGKIVEVIEGAH